MPDPRCGLKACTSGKPPVWCPVVILRPPRRYQHHGFKPATCVINIRMCCDCRDTIDLSHVLSDEGFKRMADTIVRAGKVRPAREETSLTFRFYDLNENPVDPHHQ